MIAYRINNGIATDIRFVADDYQPIEGEIVIEGESLPSQESLSDQDAWESQQSVVNSNPIQDALDWIAQQPGAPESVTSMVSARRVISNG